MSASDLAEIPLSSDLTLWSWKLQSVLLSRYILLAAATAGGGGGRPYPGAAGCSPRQSLLVDVCRNCRISIARTEGELAADSCSGDMWPVKNSLALGCNGAVASEWSEWPEIELCHSELSQSCSHQGVCSSEVWHFRTSFYVSKHIVWPCLATLLISFRSFASGNIIVKREFNLALLGFLFWYI